jgi:hypothetical protein
MGEWRDFFRRSEENGRGALVGSANGARGTTPLAAREGTNEGLKLSSALSRPFRPLDICGTRFPRPMAWAKIFRPVGPAGSERDSHTAHLIFFSNPATEQYLTDGNTGWFAGWATGSAENPLTLALSPKGGEGIIAPQRVVHTAHSPVIEPLSHRYA